MSWWMELILLVTGVLLWLTSGRRSDDVWGMFQKIIAVLLVLLVLLGGRWIPLEIAALLLAFWLPSATRLEKRELGKRL